MTTYGRQILSPTGRLVMVACDMDMEWKTGGVTIDWSTVAAVGADTTLLDDTIVKSGQKFLRFGQILTKIGVSEVETVTINGAPTGGTFTLTGINPTTGSSQTTSALAYNATAAQVQAALEAIFGAGRVSVAGNAGGPYTVTFVSGAGNVAQLTATASFTGGTSPSVALATTTEGLANAGKYGPYDPAATDGRQTLSRGNCFILNETQLEQSLIPGLNAGASDHPAVFDGGRVWRARLLVAGIMGGPSVASLAAGPTLAAFEAAFPDITYVNN